MACLYLLMVFTEDAIKYKISPKHWPLTFNVLKELQLSRIIVKASGVLSQP